MNAGTRPWVTGLIAPVTPAKAGVHEGPGWVSGRRPRSDGFPAFAGNDGGQEPARPARLAHRARPAWLGRELSRSGQRPRRRPEDAERPKANPRAARPAEDRNAPRTPWLGRELNPRHADFQSAALPTELPSRRAGNIGRAPALSKAELTPGARLPYNSVHAESRPSPDRDSRRVRPGPRTRGPALGGP